ncbi:Di-haem cytochrome c peroxidase [Pedobacter xixiisoli]|uniref:Di-haem cytochrome c peroxidase n=1 Tax=Pedobacter xixiisoli TaxID=1476464 RepID=A0A285ZZL0_9SPHI|nr:Di-haem cytochrome c peroxidase [Pedobacter xixiisoli]
MNADLSKLPAKLHHIPAYQPFFKEAIATEQPSLDQLVHAIATFQRRIKTSRSNFDRFVRGDTAALNDQQMLGLHLYRTKARCINCHSGPLFSDQNFHNIGFTLYGEAKEDLGRYAVTKQAEDVGKFKTPSLRNTTRTGPCLHNGMFQDLRGLVNTYNNGMPHPKRKANQLQDQLFPETSTHLKPLALSVAERDALIAFLESISTLPYPVNRPSLPGLD